MGRYQNIGTDNYNINMSSVSGNGTQNLFGDGSADYPISAVNPELCGDEIGDEFVSRALKKLNVKKSDASNIILHQRLAIHNEKVKESPNSKMTDEEKQEKFKPFVDLEHTRRLLTDKCSKAGIFFSELMVKMSALTGKSPREFNSMKPEIQEMLLNFVIEAIDRVTPKSIPNVSVMEAVITDCALMYEFVFTKDGEPVDIEKLTPEEIKTSRQNCDLKFKKLRAEKKAEFDKLSPEERAKAEKQLMEEFAAKRKHIFETLSKKVSFESALELLLMVSVMDLGDEAKALMESYPVEIREKIANTLQSMDTFKEYIELAKGRGESLGDEKVQIAINKYHKIFGTYKSKEKLEEYELQFLKARENGELPEEVLKPTAMGIGEAAYANINMSSEEKESFIQRWVSDNDGYLTDSDMAQVEKSAKKYIKELIDKNPELKERISFIKKCIKDIVEKTLKREFKPEKTVASNPHDNKKSKKSEQKFGAVLLSAIPQFLRPHVDAINANVIDFVKVYLLKEAAKFECPSIEKSESQVAMALLRGIITEDEAVKNLNNSEHKFILLCVKNTKLTEKFEDKIIQYIKSEKDDDKIRELAQFAPRYIVQEIIDNMRGDKIKLAEELIQMHLIDHNTIVTLENSVLKDDDKTQNLYC